MNRKKNYRLKALVLNPLTLIIYGIISYYLYSLLQYGGVKRKLPIIFTGSIILLAWVFWCVCKFRKQDQSSHNTGYFKVWYFASLFILISTTVVTGANIYKSSIPFNGKLSWFIHDLKNKKEIRLVHNNIYDDGLEGLFEDIENMVDLPAELYLSREFQLKFDKSGEINHIYTYLYGKNPKGESESFLISYDRNKSKNIMVSLKGYVDADYDEGMKLQPLMDLMQWIPLDKVVGKWDEEEYGILYRGVRSWGYNRDGIIYIDENTETRQIEMPDEIIGYTVSVYVPGKEDLISPLRYIHNGLKIVPSEEDEEAKQWDLGYNYNDGEETYFLDESLGYQLSIVDAALGSRFYALLESKDGGDTWDTINPDPFLNHTGVSSGITFIDEKLGFIGLSHSGGSYAELYRTEDGGVSFEEVLIPEIELPLNESENYNPFVFPEMPYEEDKKLFLLVGQGQEGDYKGGIKAIYESKDRGRTWEYVKESPKDD